MQTDENQANKKKHLHQYENKYTYKCEKTQPNIKTLQVAQLTTETVSRGR